MCDRTDHGDNHHSGSHHDNASARGRSQPSATTGLGRNTNSGPSAGLCLDNRLLAMDWHHLPVGAGHLGRPTTTKRSLGRRPLGVASRRLGVDSRPLAITVAQRADSVRGERLALVLHQSRILAKISGATIVASDSIMNRGVSTLNFPHVIFSLGTAPEYEPKLVVESLIWQKKPHSGTGVLTTS